jgi:DNA replication protein DnaC
MRDSLQQSPSPLQQQLDSLQQRLSPAGGSPTAAVTTPPVLNTASGFCTPGCPVCAGSGYYRTDLPIGHPEFGRLKFCPRLDLWSLPGAARFGISPQEAQQLTWDRVLATANITSTVEVIRQTLQRGYGWVYLYGGFGVGKSLLLKIAIAQSINAGVEAAYVRMAEILDHLRESYNDQTGLSESSRLDWWASLPVLSIDEFDRLRETTYGEERRFVLMDRRYEAAVNRQSVTLIASNNDPVHLPAYLCDRVSDGRFSVVHLQGSSLRPGLSY